MAGDTSAAPPRLGLVARHRNKPEIGEAIGARRGRARCHVALPVGVVERAGGVATAERGHDVALSPEQPGLIAVPGGGPNRRLRLLHGPRPDVHLPVMKILAFPIERLVMARHRLDDEVVRFPEAVHYPD